LKKDREVVFEAIKQNGYALKYADDSLKKDKEVVFEAVKQNGYALQYSDEQLKQDKLFLNSCIDYLIMSMSIWLSDKEGSVSIKDLNLISLYDRKFVRRVLQDMDAKSNDRTRFENILRKIDSTLLLDNEILTILTR